MSMAVVKELSAQWLVEMANHIVANPQFIVSGFCRAGISDALDGFRHLSEGDSDKDSSEEELSDSDFDSDGDVVGSFSSESDQED